MHVASSSRSSDLNLPVVQTSWEDATTRNGSLQRDHVFMTMLSLLVAASRDPSVTLYRGSRTMTEVLYVLREAFEEFENRLAKVERTWLWPVPT